MDQTVTLPTTPFTTDLQTMIKEAQAVGATEDLRWYITPVLMNALHEYPVRRLCGYPVFLMRDINQAEWAVLLTESDGTTVRVGMYHNGNRLRITHS